MKAVNLKCDGREKQIQADIQKISFGWNVSCTDNGAMQSAFQLRVKQDEKVLWDTGKVDSNETLHIPYQGPPLSTNMRYQFGVTVWDEKGDKSEETTAAFETGLNADSWKAKWIGYDRLTDEGFDPEKPFYCADDFELGENEYYLPPVPYLRKEFYVDEQREIEEAKLYVSAFGLVEASVNGKTITDPFTPGYSDYPKTVYAQCKHVEENIRRGNNTLAIELADGWYAGYVGLNNREWYGKTPRLLLQLEMKYTDGTSQTVCSDDTWKASYGGRLEADIFQGETFDANKEPSGWKLPDYKAEEWDTPDLGAEYDLLPQVYPGDPITIHEFVRPKEIVERDRHIFRIDFDEYICGVMKITVKGTKGSSVTLRHAEILDEKGELHLQGNRSARCQDQYILSGNGEETFSPSFTYHGFKHVMLYIEGEVELIDAWGVELSTKIKSPTCFECDNPVVEKVFHMIQATEKANLFELPTDCTARDERLGWGMEGNHFICAMTYMNDMECMLHKWGRDIWDAQRENGALEATAPPMMMKDIEQYVGDLQSNHGVFVLYTLYKMYGDTQVVRDHFEALTRYFDFMDSNSDRNIRYATSCDWLGIHEDTDHSDLNHGYGESSPTVIGTAHYAIVVQMMVELCEAIGEDKEVEKYKQRHHDIIKAFRLNYVERDGTLRYKTQGDYLMTLACGGFPEENEHAALQYLEEKLMDRGYIRWFGGTPTTPYFLHTLKYYGREDLANAFLASDKYPSIGYMATKGFDTIWERWDAIWEDGRIHPQVMNAFSHEGFASIASYIIAGLAGIDTLKQGFKHIRIAPGPSKDITRCKAIYQSGYGEIMVDWKWEGGIFSIKCRIPGNTTADLILPCTSGKAATLHLGLPREVQNQDQKALISIDAGEYEFSTETCI